MTIPRDFQDVVLQARRDVARADFIAIGIRWLARAAVLGFRTAADAVARAAERRRIVDQLSALDDRMLSDIGLRRSEIAAAVAQAERTASRVTGASRALATAAVHELPGQPSRPIQVDGPKARAA